MFLVPVDQIYATKPFKSASAKGMSWATRPAIIRQVYQSAEPPPALNKLNNFRSVTYALCLVLVIITIIIVIITVIIARALSAASIPNTKEPQRLCRSDGKRPE